MQTIRLFLSLLAFSILQPTTAQPVNRSLHPQPINLGDKLLATTINGAWLAGGAAGQYMGYPVFSPYLALADAAGNLLWERYLIDPEAMELGRVNSLSEDAQAEAFYVAGSVSGCDYLIPGYLYMLDKNGQTLWYKNSSPFFNPIATALPLQGILVSERGAGQIEWHDMAGQLTMSFDFNDEFGLQVMEMLTIGVHTVALLGKNQVLLTEWADGEVQVAAQLQLQGTKSISRAPSGQLALLASEKIYVLDASLNILHEQNLSEYGSFGKVSCSTGRCYAAGQSPEGNYIALALDAELNYQLAIDMGPGYNYPADMAALEDGLMAIGTALPEKTESEPYLNQSLFNTSKGSDIFLRSWAADGTPTPSQRNIAVEEVLVGQHDITTLPEGCSPFNDGQMQGSFSEIAVRIRNEGNIAINRLELNTVFVPCWFICYTQQNGSRTYDGLNLAPGASAILDFGNVQTWPLPLANTLDLCIWASGPDGRLDDDFSDNSACFKVVLTEVTEPPGVAGSFDLYPNPASSWLEVRFNAPLEGDAELKAIGPLGQCLYRRVLPRGQSTARLQVEQ
ncbi:MAG: hypothetical protein KDC75_22780 [Phaeodactylibacter sp.]|nr:hypothetical protein [Phaeodactylibacter sp.]